jgi:hypothetical protein
MAYDKVVDSAALDAALVGIADAIRGKTGGTGKLTLEQMAAAIAGIQAEAGSGVVESGTFTVDKDSVGVVIPVSKKCSFLVIWYPLTEIPGPFSAYNLICCCAIDGVLAYGLYINYNAQGLAANGKLASAYGQDGATATYAYFYEDSISFCARFSGNSNEKFIAGYEYNWIAW